MNIRVARYYININNDTNNNNITFIEIYNIGLHCLFTWVMICVTFASAFTNDKLPMGQWIQTFCRQEDIIINHVAKNDTWCVCLEGVGWGSICFVVQLEYGIPIDPVQRAEILAWNLHQPRHARYTQLSAQPLQLADSTLQSRLKTSVSHMQETLHYAAYAHRRQTLPTTLKDPSQQG